jgi:hypothetical protein
VRSLPPMPSGPMIWDPRMPGGLRDGLVSAGGLEHPGGDYYHDLSGRENHAALIDMNPATSWRWSDYLGRWTNFINDATYERITTSKVVGSEIGQRTHCCWVIPTAVRRPTLFGQKMTSGDFLIRWNDFGSYLTLHLRTTQINSAASSFTPYLGHWTHIAYSYDMGSNEYTVHVNASLFMSGTWSPTGSMVPSAPFGFCYSSINGNLRADVCDGLAFDRILTPPEIQWLASPANHLRVPWVRRSWRVAPTGVVPPVFNPAWAHQQSQIIGGGVL